MAKNRQYDDDDGRTVADMSGIERQPLLIPRFSKKNKRADFSEAPETDEKPEWESSEILNKKERGYFISGVLTATLGIASVFAVAIAIVILIISHMGH